MPFLRRLRQRGTEATVYVRGRIARRFESSKPPLKSTAAPPTTAAPSKLQHRLARLVPQKHLASFRSAPFSNIVAFLVLHELTAIVPFVGLTSLFYYRDIVPTQYVFGPWAGYAEEAVRGRLGWLKKKGWFGLGQGEENRVGEEALEHDIKAHAAQQRRGEADDAGASDPGKGKGNGKATTSMTSNNGSGGDAEVERGLRSKVLHKVKDLATVDNTSKGYKLGVQLVAAYAITKALLIPRIALSIWLTPSMAWAVVWAKKRTFGR